MPSRAEEAVSTSKPFISSIALSVRRIASSSSTSRIRRFMVANSRVVDCANGVCDAERAPEEIAAIPGVTWIVGNTHKHVVGQVVCGDSGFVPLSSIRSGEATGDWRPATLVGDIFAHTELLAAPVFGAGADKTRP